MSRRLFCGSQAPPSSTPELLPASVQLAKETELSVKPNREDDSKPRRRERGGDDEGPVNGVAPPRFTIIFLPRGGPRERGRGRREASLSLPLFPLRSVPFLLSSIACARTTFFRVESRFHRAAAAAARAADRSPRAARFIWLCNLRGITTFL